MSRSAASRIRAVRSRLKVYKANFRNFIQPDRVEALIRQDARKNASWTEAVRTGCLAKIAKVKAGKGKNSLSGIRFAE